MSAKRNIVLKLNHHEWNQIMDGLLFVSDSADNQPLIERLKEARNEARLTRKRT